MRICAVAIFAALQCVAAGSAADFEKLLGEYRAAWTAERPRIEADIDANRKDWLELNFTDAAGVPLTNQVVRVEQTSHDFVFGCSILSLGQLGELNAGYENSFARLFNHATTTFCLGAIEEKKGEVRFAADARDIWRRPPPDRVLQFCQARNISCKGQPLLAGSWHPRWAAKYDEAQTKALYADYFKRVAERYGHTFAMFDVVNEAFLHKKFCLYEPECHYVDWAFAEAAKYFPAECKLTLNEASMVNKTTAGTRYYKLAKRIVDSGTRLDCIGLQFHYFGTNGLYDAARDGAKSIATFRKNYEQFASLKRPLYITEITMPTTMPYGASGDGEALQAEFLENLYRFWFSQPAFAGITYWNLFDGAAYKAGKIDEGANNAGLLDYAMREKPAYSRLYQLINREWKTFMMVRTDSEGRVKVRGFRGDYVVAVDDFKFKLRLVRGGLNQQIKVNKEKKK